MSVKIAKLHPTIAVMTFVLLMICGSTASSHPGALDEHGCHEGGAENEHHCHPGEHEARLKRRADATEGREQALREEESSRSAAPDMAARMKELEETNEALSLRLERTEQMLGSSNELRGFDREIASRSFNGAYILYGLSSITSGVIGMIAILRASASPDMARLGIHWGSMVGYNLGGGLLPATLYSLQQGLDAKNSWASSLLVGGVAVLPVLYSISLFFTE